MMEGFTKVRITLLPFFIAATFACAGCGQKPDIRLASLAELKAMVPKELLAEAPEDKAAQARYQKVIGLGKSLNDKDRYALMRNWSYLPSQATGRPGKSKVTLDEQLGVVNRIWKSHPNLCADLAATLDAGPLQVPLSSALGSRVEVLIPPLETDLAYSADGLAASGDFKSATEKIILLNKLVDRLFACPSSGMTYLTAMLGESMASIYVKDLRRAAFPPAFCKQILQGMMLAPKQDLYLSSAIQTEFIKEILPKLAMDLPRLEGAGSYDAVETTKAQVKSTLIAMANAKKPLCKADVAYFEELERDEDELLKEVVPGKHEGINKDNVSRILFQTLAQARSNQPHSADTTSIRANLIRIHNSIGRILIVGIRYESEPKLSASWRAERDLTRILLASRIYRASHGGKLPDSTAGFVPILGEWPTNPFDGKPFTYSRKEEKAYGVGDDFKDHGGDIDRTFSYGKDEGISLKLTQ